MRKIVQHYRPNQNITLYDASLHAFCRGVVYMDPVDTDSFWGKLSNKVHPFVSRIFPASQTEIPWFLRQIKPHGKFYPYIVKMSKAAFVLALIGLFVTFLPIFIAQTSYAISNVTGSKSITSAIAPTPKPSLVGEVSKSQLAAESVPDKNYQEFMISIPKINVTANVIPDVDAANEDLYKAQLMNGVAHAKGSYFPGENGPVFLFSHSTDSLAHVVQYNAKFYALKDLTIGDQIFINFRGKQYTYVVTDRKIIDATSTDVIQNSQSHLILSTCYPPGTDWQRLIVFANLVVTK